jgi:hypothetical protein
MGIVEPVSAVTRKGSPSGPGWLHETKHDGFGIMAWCDGGVTPRASSAW